MRTHQPNKRQQKSGSGCHYALYATCFAFGYHSFGIFFFASHLARPSLDHRFFLAYASRKTEAFFALSHAMKHFHSDGNVRLIQDIYINRMWIDEKAASRCYDRSSASWMNYFPNASHGKVVDIRWFDAFSCCCWLRISDISMVIILFGSVNPIALSGAHSCDVLRFCRAHEFVT